MASDHQQRTRDQGIESQAQHEDKFYDIRVKRGIKHKSIFHLFTFMSSVNLKILNGALEIRYFQRMANTTLPPRDFCVYLSVSFSQIDGFKKHPTGSLYIQSM